MLQISQGIHSRCAIGVLLSRRKVAAEWRLWSRKRRMRMLGGCWAIMVFLLFELCITTLATRYKCSNLSFQNTQSPLRPKLQEKPSELPSGHRSQAAPESGSILYILRDISHALLSSRLFATCILMIGSSSLIRRNLLHLYTVRTL